MSDLKTRLQQAAAERQARAQRRQAFDHRYAAEAENLTVLTGHAVRFGSACSGIAYLGTDQILQQADWYADHNPLHPHSSYCFQPYRLYCLRVRRHLTEAHRFLLLERLDTPADAPELAALAAQAGQERYWTDPQGQTWRLEREFNRLEADVAWEDGHPVHIMLDADLPFIDGSLSQPTAVASHVQWQRLLARRSPWEAQCKACAADELMAELPEPIGNAQFERYLRLLSVNIASDGRFNAVFDDGDLFGGHEVYISGDLADGSRWQAWI